MNTASLYDLLTRGRRNETRDLHCLVAQAPKGNALVSDLLDFAGHAQANVAARAVWVLRQIAESRPELLAEYQEHILHRLTQSHHWEVKAELCHIIPKLAMDQQETASAIGFFQSCQSDSSKIVRAWSLDGLHRLSQSVPAIAPQVSELLNQALRSPAASIRARARKILRARRSR